MGNIFSPNNFFRNPEQNLPKFCQEHFEVATIPFCARKILKLKEQIKNDPLTPF